MSTEYFIYTSPSYAELIKSPMFYSVNKWL